MQHTYQYGGRLGPLNTPLTTVEFHAKPHYDPPGLDIVERDELAWYKHLADHVPHTVVWCEPYFGGPPVQVDLYVEAQLAYTNMCESLRIGKDELFRFHRCYLEFIVDCVRCAHWSNCR